MHNALLSRDFYVNGTGFPFLYMKSALKLIA